MDTFLLDLACLAQTQKRDVRLFHVVPSRSGNAFSLNNIGNDPLFSRLRSCEICTTMVMQIFA
ncbi:hypothetical protein CO676_20735 [Sinorhizobium sp. BJ1]|nr:hypothetical protein CO676_20735 [Sinorhizobium sp. BJ1]